MVNFSGIGGKMEKRITRRLDRSMARLFTATIVPDSSGYWIVEFPHLPGLHTFGRTIAQAKRNADDALAQWIIQHEEAGVAVRIRR